MKMKKEYISHSIQELQVVVDNILSGSAGDGGIPGMDNFPSEPGQYSYNDYEEESDEAVYSKTNVWGY